MSKLELIRREFLDQGIAIERDIVSDPENVGRFSVFVQIARNSKGYQTPSKLKFKQIVERLRAQQVRVDLVLLDGSQKDVTASIKTALEARFSGVVGNVFANTNPTKFVVWIEPKKRLDESTQREVTQVVMDILRVLRIEDHQVQFTSASRLPTPTAVLNTIRTLSPVTEEDLVAQLIAANFEIPNRDWMSRMLDRLRRSGRIVRLSKSEKFALSLSSLKILGSRKNRHSPDIVRALALGRRKD